MEQFRQWAAAEDLCSGLQVLEQEDTRKKSPAYVSKETSLGMMTVKEKVRRKRAVTGKLGKAMLGKYCEIRGPLCLAPQAGVLKVFRPVRRLEEMCWDLEVPRTSDEGSSRPTGKENPQGPCG